jgi:hypothetical protein
MTPRVVSKLPTSRLIPLKRYRVRDDMRDFLLAGYSCTLDSTSDSG